MKSIYRNKRPILQIEKIHSRKGGTCYHIHIYRVTSTIPLSKENFATLRTTGVLGSGQGFVVNQVLEDKGDYFLNTTTPVPDKIDWYTKVQASSYDMVSCVDIDDDTGKQSQAINPINHQPYPDKQFPFYIYEVEDHVDSSD